VKQQKIHKAQLAHNKQTHSQKANMHDLFS